MWLRVAAVHVDFGLPLMAPNLSLCRISTNFLSSLPEYVGKLRRPFVLDVG